MGHNYLKLHEHFVCRCMMIRQVLSWKIAHSFPTKPMWWSLLMTNYSPPPQFPVHQPVYKGCALLLCGVDHHAPMDNSLDMTWDFTKMSLTMQPQCPLGVMKPFISLKKLMCPQMNVTVPMYRLVPLYVHIVEEEARQLYVFVCICVWPLCPQMWMCTLHKLSIWNLWAHVTIDVNLEEESSVERRSRLGSNLAIKIT